MDENKFVIRVIVALLFAISFTLIGWTAPIMYATHTPQSEFIEVNEFSAQDVSTEADMHYACLDRTVYRSTSATVYTELYLLNQYGERVEVFSTNGMDRYFQKGEQKVMTPLQLPDNLEPGTYRYVLVTQMDLADGRVERAFAFDSEPFHIGPEYEDTPTRENFTC